MDRLTLSTVMNRLETGDVLTTQEMLQYKSEPNSIDQLITALATATDNQRTNSVELVANLGRVMIAAYDIFPERPGPIVVDDAVIGHLAANLTNDLRDVRNHSCILLAALVPGRLLEPLSEEIIQAITTYPTTDGAIVLLGKTNSPEAVELLETEAVGGASATDTQMALARSGNEQAEQAILDGYQTSTSVQDKANQARRLGYVGSERSVGLLAANMRTAEVYEWHPPATRSLRVHLIEGLHLAFMEEPLFWRPLIQPENDSYYEAIENWLTQNLGTQWSVDRPEFLYQIESPIMPSM